MRGIAVALTALALTSCVHRYLPAPSAGAVPFEATSDLRVGVARADITPPPGVSTFGHGEDSRVTNGVWTRLYCRAFVLIQGEGALAIVPCDLPSMSQLLQRRVARELKEHFHFDLPASRIMMTATHTHAGPGHFYDGTSYGGLASTQLPGYDDWMVTFLSRNIARAIAEARRSAVHADLRWTRSHIDDLTRNRNISAFIRNPDAPWADGCDLPSERCAVDRALSVLEFVQHEDQPAGAPERESPCPLGWLTFFAMHPTVLPNSNQLLGADSFGVASRGVEEHLRRRVRSGCTVTDPLGGIVNTNEGDVTSLRSSGSPEEAVAVGSAFSKHIVDAVAANHGPYVPRPMVAADYVEVDMQSNGFGLACTRTCCKAEFGVMGGFGANDHPTFITPFQPDDPRDVTRKDCQGPKRPFPLFRPQAMGPASFPSIVPFAVARLDDELVAFVPAELTYTSGYRLRAAMEKEVRGLASFDMQNIVVAGLANSYIQYVTTRAEYDAQGYEGASTLFGPDSQDLVANIAAALARRLYDPKTNLPGKLDVAEAREYWIGPERDRFPRPNDDPPLKELGSARGALKLCSLPRARPMAVCFLWADGAPGSITMISRAAAGAAPGVVEMQSRPWIGLVAVNPPNPAPALPDWQPRGMTRPHLNGTLLLDDRTVDFRTRIHDRYGDAWLWSTTFRPRPVLPGTPGVDAWDELARWGALEIRVDLGTEFELRSNGFLPKDPPPVCSAELQRLCGE